MDSLTSRPNVACQLLAIRDAAVEAAARVAQLEMSEHANAAARGVCEILGAVETASLQLLECPPAHLDEIAGGSDA
ncbi:MAG: hypothetical protein KC776_34460 [Myxococcales bacterium]|nr:hypothetical protein [Myxococcales bacterium]MCB9581010.1 hypothetical protein [Polyangiaceae bacterium]